MSSTFVEEKAVLFEGGCSKLVMGKKPSGKVRSYPSDVSDEEWEFWVVYLTLMNEQAKQSQADGDLRRRRLTWMALRSGRTIAQSS